MGSFSKRILSKLADSRSVTYFAAKIFSFNFNYKENYGRKKNKKSARNLKWTGTIIGSALFGLGLTFFKHHHEPHHRAGIFKSGLPSYTKEEVAKHTTKQSRIWVMYKEGVYDVTDYMEEHPGGEDMILQAAGRSLEPFWAIYLGHEDNDEVIDILEALRIGNLDLKPGEPVCESPEFKKNRCDYYNDPERHAVILKPLCMKPYIAGPSPEKLRENFMTPNSYCFVHNHIPVPNVDFSSYRLTVEIDSERKKAFTLNELKDMKQQCVKATLQCAANRSLEMSKEFERYVQGPAWEHNAAYTAQWKGVLLLDVLKAAGYREGDCPQHIEFESIECRQGNYSTSVPFCRVEDESNKVILAYEMNGEPLSRDHGSPLRVVIPGVAGTRWVKSLEKISLQGKESRSSWHQHHYKKLDCTFVGPEVNEIIVESAPAVEELPVNSAICKPADGEDVHTIGGKVEVKGYALSGGGQKITTVEVSGDEGKTWVPAKITHTDTCCPPYHFTWAFWTADVPVQKGRKFLHIWAKATDSANNTQPEKWKWNYCGVACNAIHKIRVFVLQ
ncbi:unnamed protein product [Psylliodes chrysocephalus]|uniref:sulfite oxidase n=1 Tax=Psylliodes chrysocephalus TaxID=3402493 RepID=A0A9P0GBK8_9CUCU|nr:unnamed protein product [Psylliodes chrysocephala]